MEGLVRRTEEVPSVSGDVEEDRDAAIGLGTWRGHERAADRFPTILLCGETRWRLIQMI
ncbi:hypothetical protein [Pseudonocardia sp.]|jgi:hypothetical protein|uniref:hypothetical protein n=1 Tax=Pseudonocardia sp. TaxID=60912 RepID=UPI00262C1987|nr:hypothetical protein [Pseudonocardia sp.]